jgi:hypothetical protein
MRYEFQRALHAVSAMRREMVGNVEQPLHRGDVSARRSL